MATDTKLSKKDFATDQEVRWCPGCGDYAILSAAQQVFPTLGVPKEKFVIVSGIGCSSRFPYYMNTYGFHTIHGRAPAVATGIKLTNPDLSVWIVTGDGDALSIGGNHIIHLMRRNVGVKVMLFDNRIYGLTKGQFSPTSEIGKRTKSTPFGSVDRPFRVVQLALGAGATFVARTVDTYTPHLKQTLRSAHEHSGLAFVQIFQNCNIFNDGAFDDFREKGNREENLLHLKHGEPLVFGKNRDRGIRMKNPYEPEVIKLGNGVTEADLLIHDESAPLGYATMLAQLKRPDFPLPVGVIRRIERATFDGGMNAQIGDVVDQRGPGDLHQAIYSGSIWTVD
jgi:2-oxoglutarate ferredoxin oxidoreductase subunit beta